MKNLVLNKRIKGNGHTAKRERRKGFIPGVIYGKNIGNYMFEVSDLELNKELLENGEHGVLNLNLEGNEVKGIIKEIQKDPINKHIIHVDIQEVNKNDLVQSEIPIVLEGEGLVSKKGGILQKEKTNIKVQCKPDMIPDSIKVDVSKFHIGNVLRVADLEVSEELTVIEDMDTVILTVTSGNTKAIEDDEEMKEIQE